MKNIISIYPDGIDSRVFFSDLSLEHVDLMNQYQSLIAQNKYSDASKLVNESDASFYGAWIYNLLDYRLCNIGNYLLTKEQPKLITFQSEEPSDDLSLNMTWIGD